VCAVVFLSLKGTAVSSFLCSVALIGRNFQQLFRISNTFFPASYFSIAWTKRICPECGGSVCLCLLLNSVETKKMTIISTTVALET
jgi:hypothetical protein